MSEDLWFYVSYPFFLLGLAWFARWAWSGKWKL